MHDPRHVTPEILAAVSAAFAAHDVEGIVEGIVESFVEDGVFVNGKGPAGGGDTYAGKAAIRAFFTELFRITPEV